MSVEQKLVIDGVVPVTGQFLMRPTSKKGDKACTLMCGSINGAGFVDNGQDEIWLVTLVVADVKRYKFNEKAKKYFGAMRIDQILTHNMNIGTHCTPIEEDSSSTNL